MYFCRSLFSNPNANNRLNQSDSTDASELVELGALAPLQGEENQFENTTVSQNSQPARTGAKSNNNESSFSWRNLKLALFGGLLFTGGATGGFAAARLFNRPPSSTGLQNFASSLAYSGNTTHDLITVLNQLGDLQKLRKTASALRDAADTIDDELNQLDQDVLDLIKEHFGSISEDVINILEMDDNVHNTTESERNGNAQELKRGKVGRRGGHRKAKQLLNLSNKQREAQLKADRKLLKHLISLVRDGFNTTTTAIRNGLSAAAAAAKNFPSESYSESQQDCLLTNNCDV